MTIEQLCAGVTDDNMHRQIECVKPIEITKEHVGKCIVAIPTGNNVVRGLERQELINMSVISFGERYVRIGWSEYHINLTLCPKTGASQEAVKTGHSSNAGYLFFESADDANSYLDEAELRTEAGYLLREYSATSRLSLSTIKQIISELGGELI